jgi:hypothetical protein
MWVLTELENDAGVATYESAGASDQSPHLMFNWRLKADVASSGA